MKEYREYAPSAALANYVECYWSRGGFPDVPGTPRVLPDGCIDILFEFASGQGRAYVIGPMTRALVIGNTRPDQYVGVRFRPGGAFAFFDLPMHALTDARIELADVWQDAAELEESVNDSVSVSRQVQLLDQMLCARLSSIRPLDQQIQLAISSLKSSSGLIPIDTLSSGLGITRQHLNRKFQAHIGLNSKTFARIVRMHHLLATARNLIQVDWCMLALETGYYDQAHMIDDFRDLCGISPARYLASV
jgi:AraC-like DNA-binding protein